MVEESTMGRKKKKIWKTRYNFKREKVILMVVILDEPLIEVLSLYLEVRSTNGRSLKNTTV